METSYHPGLPTTSCLGLGRRFLASSFVKHTRPSCVYFVGLELLCACRDRGRGLASPFAHTRCCSRVLQQNGEWLCRVARVSSRFVWLSLVDFWPRKMGVGSCVCDMFSFYKGSSEAAAQLFVLVLVLEEWERCQILILCCSNRVQRFSALAPGSAGARSDCRSCGNTPGLGRGSSAGSARLCPHREHTARSQGTASAADALVQHCRRRAAAPVPWASRVPLLRNVLVVRRGSCHPGRGGAVLCPAWLALAPATTGEEGPPGGSERSPQKGSSVPGKG